jgi:hypothetical protein
MVLGSYRLVNFVIFEMTKNFYQESYLRLFQSKNYQLISKKVNSSKDWLMHFKLYLMVYQGDFDVVDTFTSKTYFSKKYVEELMSKPSIHPRILINGNEELQKMVHARNWLKDDERWERYKKQFDKKVNHDFRISYYFYKYNLSREVTSFLEPIHQTVINQLDNLKIPYINFVEQRDINNYLKHFSQPTIEQCKTLIFLLLNSKLDTRNLTPAFKIRTLQFKRQYYRVVPYKQQTACLTIQYQQELLFQIQSNSELQEFVKNFECANDTQKSLKELLISMLHII